MYEYDKKAMKLVWLMLAVTFVPLAIFMLLFTDLLSTSVVPDILYLFSGLSLGMGVGTLLTLPRPWQKVLAGGIILAYSLLLFAGFLALWSLGQSPPPGWIIWASEDLPERFSGFSLPEQFVYGTLGGLPGPALGRFLNQRTPEDSTKREAQLALLAVGGGLTLALLVSVFFGL